MVRCNVLNITSNYSPHVDDTVALNARLDPACCSWMKIQDCGLVLEEQPGKVMEALRLFLQGQGYAVAGAARRASCVPSSAGSDR
ncbi:protein NDRG3 [Hyalella azteca]|uniref:Protein NDRG3 n=1 Tax=Hyalella azteca TaxID=294128 RepID=A0A8B7P317_HYAAZ|nr:protein NDRG3 [Hyalella azteca]